MTSKERARLRGLANGMETVLQIGKDGIWENLIHQADITLEARELMKGRVLDGCILSPREAAEALAQATGSEVVQVIGSKFALYRKKKSAETEKKASKPRNSERRKTPSPSLRDISPKRGDANGKAGQKGGKRFRALSGAKSGRRDIPETGRRNEKRSPSLMGRGTGGRGSGKANAGPRKPLPSGRSGPRKPFHPSGQRNGDKRK